ncbi:hypothetical protein OFB51_25245, partial [Escherichia coli]|nr:hypothetical protein [Escherichia coli]
SYIIRRLKSRFTIIRLKTWLTVKGRLYSESTSIIGERSCYDADPRGLGKDVILYEEKKIGREQRKLYS